MEVELVRHLDARHALAVSRRMLSLAAAPPPGSTAQIQVALRLTMVRNEVRGARASRGRAQSADVGERIVLSFLYGSITRSMGGHVMLCCACSRALDSNERQGFKSSTKTPLVEQCASIVMAAPAFACTGTVVKVPVTRAAIKNLMLSHSKSENGIDVLDSYLLKLSTTPPDWIIFRHFPGCIVSIANW